MTTAFLVTHDDCRNMACACYVQGDALAAGKLAVSEATIRRIARNLGVKRIAGPVVAGFICWPHAHGNHPVLLNYAS